jgi:hypothetical protein
VGPGDETCEEAGCFLKEFARETGLEPALERVLGLRDKLGVDAPPGDGGAGREEKRPELRDVVEVVEIVERGLLYRGRGAMGVEAGTSRESQEPWVGGTIGVGISAEGRTGK